MKIAMIDPSLFTWPYDIKIVQGLDSIGHEVRLFGRTPSAVPPAEEGVFLHRHFYPGIDTKLLRRLPSKVFLMLKGASHVESMARLWFALKAWKPDIIHFQWAPLPVVDQHFVEAFRRIAPTVLTVHDTAPFNNNPRAGLQRLGAIEIMKRFDHLIVHTQTGQARLEGYGIQADKISRIPHGLLSAAGHRVTTPRPEGGPVSMLMFGQIKPYKGVDVLFRAVAALPDDVRPLARIRIVGKPYMDMQPLFDLADSLGIRPQIEFDLRFVPEEEVPSLLASADIQLFPYREIEASGVLMLALGVARPIVASRIGLFAEVLEDGRHGALVKPDDADDLSRALAPLVASRDRRIETGNAVAALADAIPSWQGIAEMTAAMYHSKR